MPVISPDNNLENLPQSPGVYCFRDEKGRILYIGKSVNIRQRVKNHLGKGEIFAQNSSEIGYLPTFSEIEALILEARLIKKHRPKFNVIWKDDKNYFFAAITREECPRVYVTHQTIHPVKSSAGSGGAAKQQFNRVKYIGPFVEGRPLKNTLRVLRKVFPYYTQPEHPRKLCPWCHLDLCPGPEPDIKNYRKNIKNLTAVLEGKKDRILKQMSGEMENFSRQKNYEKAAEMRDQMRSLEKVFLNARVLMPETSAWRQNWLKTEEILQKILKSGQSLSRMEAYDISNIQGREATGSMVAFLYGNPDKKYYRKFRIKIQGKPNDTAMISEVLRRRFNHPEWPLPSLVLIDGGKGQLNAALGVRDKRPAARKIRVVALAKRNNELYFEGRRKPILLKNTDREVSNLMLHLRDEAHRFAVKYHRKLRKDALLS